MATGFQDFSATYTDTNVALDAAPYDPSVLGSLVSQLEQVDNGSIKAAAAAIVATMLCAQRRGDAVPKLYEDLTRGKSDDEKRALFLSIRHGLTLTWGFSGLPNCVPACLGLVNKLREDGISVTHQLDRPLLHETDWLPKGNETRQAIYRAVGNSEVGSMIGDFFPEISYIANAALFGFLIGGSTDEQSLPLSEIVIAGAITAMGATRQARSHLKASIGLGISTIAVDAVVDAAKQVASWNKAKLPHEFDVKALAEEAKANLEALDRTE